MRDSEAWSGKLALCLRHKMTRAEVILWSRLRRNEVPGRRFRRQHPIGPYVAGFACVPARLVVEVDGGTHSTSTEVLHDRRRDAYMKGRGWRILRVTNEDIYKNLDTVLDGIVRFAPPPRPSAGPPPRAGEEN